MVKVSMEPATQDHRSLIPKVREKFAELFAGSISSGVYDERDLERLRSEDDHVLNFIIHQKGSVEKASAMIDLSLKFRKQYELNDLTEKSFPRQFHENGACFYHNEDKNGHKILFFQVKKNRKDPEKQQQLKKFVAWWIDKHYLLYPRESMVVVFDMTDAGFGNVDIDLLKFQISCFTTYYPAMLEYMLIYEMPWVLNAIWKVIKTLLTAEQQKRVIFVSKNNIQQYISKDQLFLHMGGADLYDYTFLPTEDSGLESLNGELQTPEFEELEDLSSSPASDKGFDIDPNKSNTPKKKVTFAEKDQLQMMYTNGEDEADSSPSGRPKTIYKPSTSLNSFIKKRKKEEDAYVGTTLTIIPAEELVFTIADEKRESLDIVSLLNKIDKNVAFKVKTTSPERYRVRPSTGIVKPNSSIDIHVYLHPGNLSNVVKDKFLVMYMPVEADTTVLQVNELFKVTPKEQYLEHKLRCRVGQSSPPSPSEENKLETVHSLGNQIEQLTFSHQNLERKIRQMFILMLIQVFAILTIIVCTGFAYYNEVLPFTKYTVSTCTPPYSPPSHPH